MPRRCGRLYDHQPTAALCADAAVGRSRAANSGTGLRDAGMGWRAGFATTQISIEWNPMPLLDPQAIRTLHAAATAAPSADNCPTCQLEITESGAGQLRLGDFMALDDIHRALNLISAGALLENLSIRASTLGLSMAAHWDEAGFEHNPSVYILFAAGPVSPDKLDAWIEQRHSNRRLLFRGPPLSGQAQATIEACVQGRPGARVIWLDAPADRREALRMMLAAETERFRNKALHAELFTSIRFDAADTGKPQHGIPVRALELLAVERPLFQQLRHWRLQKLANFFGVHHLMGLRAAFLPGRLAPHLCAIACEGTLTAASIEAGRHLQRIWITANAMGLSFQVFAAAAIYSIPGDSAVPPALQDELRARWHALLGGRVPNILFRMGHAPPPTMRAGRQQTQ